MYFQYGEAETAYLSAKDERMAAVIAQAGHIEREVDTDLFSAVVHHIVGQQISTKAQATIWKRMRDEFGVVDAAAVLGAGVEKLQSFGMTFRKAEYITDFARKIESGEFNTYASYVYREKTQSGLKSENTKQVALYLKGKTLFENSKKVKLYNRVGKAENAFWYDLRTEDWKFVKITEEGWEIREEDKILFDRYNHQKEAVFAAQKRRYSENLEIHQHQEPENPYVFSCWFGSAALLPDIVHSAIIVFGRKGTAAKTTACTFLKKAIDPSIVKTLSLHKDMPSKLIGL